MRIGGFQKFSLIDFPGKVSCVIFTQGCNFRCSYCHNKKLVLPNEFTSLMSEEEIMVFLEKRRHLLHGVVITGGEPTIQHDLKDFMRKIKALGYAVKLDTNGSRPDFLREIIDEKLVDFIAMDIKGPFSRYKELTGVDVDLNQILESVKLVEDSEIEYMFRTTVVKPLLQPQDLLQIAMQVKEPRKYVLQTFVAHEDVLDGDLLDKGHYDEADVEGLREMLNDFVIDKVVV
ncbi:MAG: anaerobic ribonucleoside-triphosphate reductase activating protein [Candidatus Omnitrophica bacterium]|nr:anaerobic ribonucleoside-triphosphate reductase activating protein [Candidatus Omnitrophota bacterium]